MKRKFAAILAAAMIALSAQTAIVQAATVDVMIGKVINKMNENQVYYDIIMEMKDSINKDLIKTFYNNLSPQEKALVHQEIGAGTTEEQVLAELDALTSADINNIKARLNALEQSNTPTTPTQPPAGGGTPPPAIEPTQPTTPGTPEIKPEAPKVVFNDISDLWTEAKESIAFMVEGGVLNGKTAGTFAPHDNMTRAEFAKTIVILLKLTDTSTANKSFTDITTEDWYYDYVTIAFKNGIINGKTENTFEPNSPITRQEMAAMTARALRLKKKSEILMPLQVRELLSTYNDSSNIADWAYNDMGLIVKNNIIGGREGNNLAPQENATRAEVVVILMRLYNLINNIN